MGRSKAAIRKQMERLGLKPAAIQAVIPRVEGLERAPGVDGKTPGGAAGDGDEGEESDAGPADADARVKLDASFAVPLKLQARKVRHEGLTAQMQLSWLISEMTQRISANKGKRVRGNDEDEDEDDEDSFIAEHALTPDDAQKVEDVDGRHKHSKTRFFVYSPRPPDPQAAVLGPIVGMLGFKNSGAGEGELSWRIPASVSNGRLAAYIAALAPEKRQAMEESESEDG